MKQKTLDRISIQVSLSGYSFKVGNEKRSAGWTSPAELFGTTEFQKRYETVEISLLTPKFSLVPDSFFNPFATRSCLDEVAELNDTDKVEYIALPWIGAKLVYSASIGESLSRLISKTVLKYSGEESPVLPEIYYLLRDMHALDTEYNKVHASYADGWLHLTIAQGRSLLLANAFRAQDFTTAEYFLLSALKKLQLNPEVSTAVFHTPLSEEEEISLYRYFRGVEVV